MPVLLAPNNVDQVALLDLNLFPLTRHDSRSSRDEEELIIAVLVELVPGAMIEIDDRDIEIFAHLGRDEVLASHIADEDRSGRVFLGHVGRTDLLHLLSSSLVSSDIDVCSWGF